MTCEYAQKALEEAQRAALKETGVEKTVACGHPGGCPVSSKAMSHVPKLVSGELEGSCVLGKRLSSNSKSPNVSDS